MAEIWQSVKKFADGESLNQTVLNTPVKQLESRTNYLKGKVDSLSSSGSFSAVVLSGVTLSEKEGEAPSVGNVVYLDTNGRFAAAKATMSLYDDFKSAESSFTVGLLQAKDAENTRGDVVLYGKVSLKNDGASLSAEDVIESGEEFRPGRYYLSPNEAGRLTKDPNGPRIYVCTISSSSDTELEDAYALVNPQFLDIGTSHVHRTAVLTARPAGYESVDGYCPLTDDGKEIGSEVLKDYPSLRFGGTWTADKKVDYSFYLKDAIASWSPAGISLYWTENGDSKEYSVSVHAPDEEVEISNGLTVRLSLPKSGNGAAYAHIGAVRWVPLTFPDAGSGWTKHEAVAIASKDISEDNGNANAEVRVMVRGKLDMTYGEIGVAFPSKVLKQTFKDNPVKGDTFTYSGVTFTFTDDVSAITELSFDDVPTSVNVALGTNASDSIHYLAEAMNSVPYDNKGTFLSFGPELLILDGVDSDNAESANSANFSAVRADGAKAVVFDVGSFKVVSSKDIVENISSCKWNDAGDIDVMLYGVGDSADITVPVGTIVYGKWFDDEPDAKYDYVLGLDPTVAKYWPPIPVKSAALIVNGVEMDNKALVPDAPTVSFGKDTIHWFADESGKRPWPETFVNRDSGVSDPAYDKSEILHWVRGFQGATGPVTSIQPKEGAPIKIYGYGTFDSANTGDLEIDADLDLKIVDGGVPGHMVPKRAQNGMLVAGPVVERIVGGAGVNVISQAGSPTGQGTVVIALDNGSYNNQFSDIALENAEQAKIGMFPYIRLKGYTTTITSPSAFTATMRVPTNLPNGSYALELTASVFGETGFAAQASQEYASVKFGYNILPDYSAEKPYQSLKYSLLKPSADRTVNIQFGHEENGLYRYSAFDPIYVTTKEADEKDVDDVLLHAFGERLPDTNEFSDVVPDLRPGYLVGIRMSRAVTSGEGLTAYKGAIGVINLSWSLVSVSGGYAVASSSDDIYARDTTSGLYHKVVAVQDDDGTMTLGVDQEGVNL